MPAYSMEGGQHLQSQQSCSCKVALIDLVSPIQLPPPEGMASGCCTARLQL